MGEGCDSVRCGWEKGCDSVRCGWGKGCDSVSMCGGGGGHFELLLQMCNIPYMVVLPVVEPRLLLALHV